MATLFIIFIALAIGGVFIYLAKCSTPEYKGKMGEERVHNILMQLPEEYYLIDDVVLETGKGTTQIDHVVVSKYGVFAIETKNYRGEIYGDDNRKEWTQMIVTEVTYPKKWWKTYTYVTKSHFYNPVKQSLAHVYAVKKLLSDWPNLPIVPIVVFVGSGILKDVASRYHVIYDYTLLETILNYRTIYLTDNDLQNIVSRLSANNVGKIVDQSTHVNNIWNARYEVDEKIAAGICPKCGGTLVYRTGKYGGFYGCSNYPKCKFTTD